MRSSVPSGFTRSEPTGSHVCGRLPFLKLVRFAPMYPVLPTFQGTIPAWKRHAGLAMKAADLRRPSLSAFCCTPAHERLKRFPMAPLSMFG